MTLPPIPDLPRELAGLLRQIPPGRITTYGELAGALGDERAARWVGEWLVNHAHTAECPCHRVVRKTGEPGLYGGGAADAKLRLLRQEGHILRGGRLDVSDRMTAAEFRSRRSLEGLKKYQIDLSGRLNLAENRDSDHAEYYCGLDVAYQADGTAVAAAVVLDTGTLTTQLELVVCESTRFPYLSGYLTFRELPILLKLWSELPADVRCHCIAFVDGNGILHPRRAGIAACFGVEAGVPTIGVGKSLLCGRLIEAPVDWAASGIVIHDEQPVAAVLKSRSSTKPIYISPGNLLSLPQAVPIANRCLTDHRLPEPVHRADRLSKRSKLRCQ